jgi:hypothetical protein
MIDYGWPSFMDRSARMRRWTLAPPTRSMHGTPATSADHREGIPVATDAKAITGELMY